MVVLKGGYEIEIHLTTKTIQIIWNKKYVITETFQIVWNKEIPWLLKQFELLETKVPYKKFILLLTFFKKLKAQDPSLTDIRVPNLPKYYDNISPDQKSNPLITRHNHLKPFTTWLNTTTTIVRFHLIY